MTTLEATYQAPVKDTHLASGTAAARQTTGQGGWAAMVPALLAHQPHMRQKLVLPRSRNQKGSLAPPAPWR